MLKFLLWLLIIYYLLKFLFRLFMPIFLKKIMSRMQENFSRYTYTNKQEEEGNISIKNKEIYSSKKTKSDNLGDYVDFEELE